MLAGMPVLLTLDWTATATATAGAGIDVMTSWRNREWCLVECLYCWTIEVKPVSSRGVPRWFRVWHHDVIRRCLHCSALLMRIPPNQLDRVALNRQCGSEKAQHESIQKMRPDVLIFFLVKHIIHLWEKQLNWICPLSLATHNLYFCAISSYF